MPCATDPHRHCLLLPDAWLREFPAQEVANDDQEEISGVPETCQQASPDSKEHFEVGNESRVVSFLFMALDQYFARRGEYRRLFPKELGRLTIRYPVARSS